MTDIEHLTDPSEEPNNQTNEVEFDATRFAVRAIDQAVVDGLVDGRGRRIHIKLLTSIGFRGAFPAEEEFDDFRQALVEDQRYVESDETRYSYHPVLLGPTEARATARAIVRGAALVSPEERREVMDLMNSAANAIIRSRDKSRPTVRRGEIKDIAQRAGIFLDGEQEFALVTFMQGDRRFKLSKDVRRIRIVNFSQEAEPLRPIDQEVSDEIYRQLDEVLANLRVDSRGEFAFRNILGTFNRMGIQLSDKEIHQVKVGLRQHDRIMDVGGGVLRLMEQPSSSGSPIEALGDRVEEASSLREKIQIALGGTTYQKPRGRQNGKKTGYRAKQA